MQNNIKNRSLIIFLMGPTASGKTSIAMALKKQQHKIDIISVDSALIYKGMDIGTAKPSAEELKIAPHKLIDIRDPNEYYSVADFYYDAYEEIEEVIQNGRIPLLVGGTMLYFKTLLHGLCLLPTTNREIRQNIQYEAQEVGWTNMYSKLKCIDPVAASIIHINDHRRIIRALEIFFVSGKTWTELKLISNNTRALTYRICQFAVMPSNREILNKRIEQRFYQMLDVGFENEVSVLFARPELHQSTKPSMFCVGYRQMWEYFSGNISYYNMIVASIYATRQLAKRQFTWLHKWSDLHWLSADNISVTIDNILKILKKNVF